jgi:hypothetical protein
VGEYFGKILKTGASRWTLFNVVIVDARNHEPEIFTIYKIKEAEISSTPSTHFKCDNAHRMLVREPERRDTCKIQSERMKQTNHVYVHLPLHGLQ